MVCGLGTGQKPETSLGLPPGALGPCRWEVAWAAWRERSSGSETLGPVQRPGLGSLGVRTRSQMITQTLPLHVSKEMRASCPQGVLRSQALRGRGVNTNKPAQRLSLRPGPEPPLPSLPVLHPVFFLRGARLDPGAEGP